MGCAPANDVFRFLWPPHLQKRSQKTSLSSFACSCLGCVYPQPHKVSLFRLYPCTATSSMGLGMLLLLMLKAGCPAHIIVRNHSSFRAYIQVCVLLFIYFFAICQ